MEIIVAFDALKNPVINSISKFPGIYYPTFITKTGSSYLLLNAQIAIQAGFTECKLDGKFYATKEHEKYAEQQRWDSWGKTNFTKKKKDLSLTEQYKYGLASPTNIIMEGKKYTFGLEIETVGGFIPPWKLQEFNVSMTTDGSVRDKDGNKYTGAEYITGVLFGDYGFKHLQELCYELTKRCTINNTASVHVHIGGCNFNKDFTVLAWMLGQKIQKEIFSMMPPSRLKENPYTKKQYCKLLKSRNFSVVEQAYKTNHKEYREAIELTYNDIFADISQGRFPTDTFNKTKSTHPGGRWCEPRYYWLNFIGFNFIREHVGAYTCEFRSHGASTSFNKIKNWVLICAAITYFIENNQHDILTKKNITLSDIITAAFPRSAKALISYIEQRKKLFGITIDDGDEYSQKEEKLIKMKDLCAS